MQDQVTPHGPWVFDRAVVDVFDDMLKRSIPEYETMRSACFDVGSKFVKPKTDILDLGCSRGESLAPFVARFGCFNRFVGIESSSPMIEACRERFAGYIKTGIVDIRDFDLRAGYPPVLASLTLAVLTIQFVPTEHRPRIFREAYRTTRPGGAMILVEKIVGETDATQSLFVDRYHARKMTNGYTSSQIEAKRKSLEGVLMPTTAKANEDMLRNAGFNIVECFWRWMNFAGWIAIRDEN